MIEGLKVTIPGEELARMCREYADYHRKRITTYSEQILNFETAKVEAANFTGGDPVQALKAKRESHGAEADELEFMAKWLDKSSSYRLTRDELRRIGVIRGGIF